MRIELTKQVAAPPEQVFAIASDFARAAEHVRAIEQVELLTSGQVGVGTRFRETRRMFGRSHAETLEVTAFDPPRSYTVGCESCGCRYRSEFRFEPNAGGTEMQMSFEAVPLTWFARVMAFLMRPMVKKMIAECGKDLDDVAAVAERRPVA